MPAWNDGLVGHGARKIKIYQPDSSLGSAGTTWTTNKGIYVLESWSPTRPSYHQNRYDEVRNPNGAFGVDDYVEATAVVQLATTASFLVDTGDAFTTARASDNESNGGSPVAESWVVVSVDEPEEQGAIKKQTIRVQKLYVTTGPTVYP